MKVKDITFKEFLTLEDSSLYSYYLKYGKLEPLDIFEIGSFIDLSFGFVKDMQYNATYSSSGLTWQVFTEGIAKVKNKSLEDFSDISIFDMHRARLHIIEQVDLINEMEANSLSYASTPEQQQANLDRFAGYGSFLQFDALAGGDLLKIEQVKAMSYKLCFTKLKLDADRANYQQDYNNIISQKNK